MPKQQVLSIIGTVLVAILVCIQPVDAQAHGLKPGSSKASPKNRTHSQAKAMHSKAIKDQLTKVETLKSQLNNNLGRGIARNKRFGQDTAALRQASKAISAHHDAKVVLNKLIHTSYVNFATARGYRLIPNPPTAALPPLPPPLQPSQPNRLRVTFREVRKDAKSKRPPGMPSGS